MSDPSDSFSEAVSLNKKLAARLLVRKEQLVDDIASARARGAGVETLTSELASTEQEFAGALAEVAQLRRLAAKGPSAAAIRAAVESDPLTPSLEDAALERAREGIAETEIEASLTPDSPRASSAPAKPSPAKADEQARQEFERLRGNGSKGPGRTM